MPGRPSQYHMARMRHRCTVQSAVETQDAAGQPVVSWSNFLVNEPCQCMPMRGSEEMRGRELEASFQTIFRVRYRLGYNEQMRIVFQNKNYGIRAIEKVDGLDRYLELHTVTA